MDLQDSDGLSSLMAASSTGNVKMVKLLLEHNAQVHLVGKNGATALTVASAFSYPEIVRLIIGKNTEKKAKVNHPPPAIPVRHFNFRAPLRRTCYNNRCTKIETPLFQDR